MRYANEHNFLGHPVHGYDAPECILTRPAAIALREVQKKLKSLSLSLKVYDCYRPQMAVNEFIQWSKQTNQQQMKNEFYPRIDKRDFFKLGYVAEKSGHSRGSTVDLTIVRLPMKPEPHYHRGQALTACNAPYNKRYPDHSIDMGTGFDCMDPDAHLDATHLTLSAIENRKQLIILMQQQGFKPYPYEWWHFTLKEEPYPDTYFNFRIQPKEK
jgi:D-alanyl-D-alanine dipeptidase